jgi:GNAT superfamily N-acetyltransferase
MIMRRTDPADAAALVGILNRIIAIGGTTAMDAALDAPTFRHWFIDGPEVLATLTAVRGGQPVAFQTLSAHEVPGPGWADIGTFVLPGMEKGGIGSQLFPVTAATARTLGLRWINATICNDNRGGLAYYRRLGFQPYGSEPDWRRGDGTLVGRVRTRFDLTVTGG